MRERCSVGVGGNSQIEGSGVRARWVIAVSVLVLLGCLAAAKAAEAACPCVVDASKLSLDVSGDGDFNLLPGTAGDSEDPSFFFRQDIGAEGDAGLAIFIPALDQAFGLAGDSWFTKDYDVDPVAQQTEDGWLVTSHYWVDDPNFSGDGTPPVYLDITERILLSYDNQTVSVRYSITNSTGAPLRFRPYLLGAPYLLDLSQFETEDNTVKSAYSNAPAPTLSMSSTKTNRTLTVASTGDTKADSAQVYGYDADTGELSLDLLYYDVMEPGEGTSFGGPFDTSALTDPGFGMEWSDWMSNSGLGAGQTAELRATFSITKSTQGGQVGGIPVSGTIQFKPPGGAPFQELKPGDEIPSGSIIDASDGTIQISARGTGGAPQTAAFTGGQFKLIRSAKSPFTNMQLTGPLDCGAASSLSSTASGTRTRRGKGGRSLWGSGKGKFRTSGKRGSGSVRGTTWQVTDNCDGSTKVQSLRGASQGKVDVKDFGKPRKKIVLNPGQSYLAKPGK